MESLSVEVCAALFDPDMWKKIHYRDTHIGRTESSCEGDFK